jgi:dipeptidyl aminopeptidase/acylaminoacyl peptidase
MAEFFNNISPTTNAHKITKPLFVVQGLNDPCVPASETEQMVAKIHENGGDVCYILAKDMAVKRPTVIIIMQRS